MKKCNCGKEMEDWMTLCGECYGKRLDGKRSSAEGSKDRAASIERQVAAKCAAQMLQGTTSTSQEDVVACFNLFLKLIRGQ